eukprot:749940-Hanusia_phi.AAC.1
MITPRAPHRPAGPRSASRPGCRHCDTVSPRSLDPTVRFELNEGPQTHSSPVFCVGNEVVGVVTPSRGKQHKTGSEPLMATQPTPERSSKSLQFRRRELGLQQKDLLRSLSTSKTIGRRFHIAQARLALGACSTISACSCPRGSQEARSTTCNVKPLSPFSSPISTSLVPFSSF